jgi:hypothetical protein
MEFAKFVLQSSKQQCFFGLRFWKRLPNGQDIFQVHVSNTPEEGLQRLTVVSLAKLKVFVRLWGEAQSGKKLGGKFGRNPPSTSSEPEQTADEPESQEAAVAAKDALIKEKKKAAAKPPSLPAPPTQPAPTQPAAAVTVSVAVAVAAVVAVAVAALVAVAVAVAVAVVVLRALVQLRAKSTYPLTAVKRIQHPNSRYRNGSSRRNK